MYPFIFNYYSLSIVATNPKQTTEYWVTVKKELVLGDEILWNYKPLTWRFENTSDVITTKGMSLEEEGTGFYYDNLPKNLRKLLPLLGTNDMMSSDNNTLYLPETTVVYMIKQEMDQHSEENLDVDVVGWTYTGNDGYYLGPNYTDSFQIYQKIMRSGLHQLDDNAALYLFVPSKF